jgi:UDPglucose 6-dehydrogenase
MHPDRIVVGVTNQASAAIFRDLYLPFVIDDPAKLLIMDRHSSELTKYAANAMLATRISFMNEMSRLCEKVGADIDNVRRGMGADPRIGRKFLYAGPGYGGSCFPKDVEALVRTAGEHGIDFEVVKAVSTANDKQKKYVAKKILKHFGNNLKGKHLAVWGLAFKPGTDDVREAPAITIIEELLASGATVNAHDPEASKTFATAIGPKVGLTYAKSAYEALKDADALVHITEWSEYKRPNWAKVKTLLRQPVIFDFRNQYDRALMEKAGFHYDCVGRP